jgi:hypothetical protein
MNKAEKMKKLALSMKDLFKRKGSFDDRRLYRSCLRRIKTEAKKGKLEDTFRIDECAYNNVNIEMVVAWLEKDGFEIALKPFFSSEIDRDLEFVDDWEMKVKWE